MMLDKPFYHEMASLVTKYDEAMKYGTSSDLNVILGKLLMCARQHREMMYAMAYVTEMGLIAAEQGDKDLEVIVIAEINRLNEDCTATRWEAQL